MDVDRLRAETRPEHEATETLLPLMDAGLTRERYRNVLLCLHRIVQTWEQWAEEHAPPPLVETVHLRRRAALLHADLLALGHVALEHGEEAQAEGLLNTEILNGFLPVRQGPAAFEAAFLGAMYVMEGSTLGGQYIARHVEDALSLAPGVGNAYFRGYGEKTGSMWQAFKQLLLEVPDEQTDVVIAAAKGMFAFFGDGLRACSFSEAQIETD